MQPVLTNHLNISAILDFFCQNFNSIEFRNQKPIRNSFFPFKFPTPDLSKIPFANKCLLARKKLRSALKKQRSPQYKRLCDGKNPAFCRFFLPHFLLLLRCRRRWLSDMNSILFFGSLPLLYYQKQLHAEKTKNCFYLSGT
jgi:hypothetical protein